MRKKLLIAALLTAIGVGSQFAMAQTTTTAARGANGIVDQRPRQSANDPRPSVNRGDPGTSNQTMRAEQFTSSAASRPANDDWRYVWQNDHWWYYTPNNHWLYWHIDRWNALPPPPAMTIRDPSRNAYSAPPMINTFPVEPSHGVFRQSRHSLGGL